MKVEFKNVKSMPGEETPAFVATLYVDDLRHGQVRSGGTGGPPFIQWNSRGEPDGWRAWCVEKAAEFHAEDKVHFPEVVGDCEPPTEFNDFAQEMVLFGLYARWEEAKYIKKRSRKVTLYRASGQTYGPGEWSVHKAPLTDVLRAEITKHFTAKLQQVTFALDTLEAS